MQLRAQSPQFRFGRQLVYFLFSKSLRTAFMSDLYRRNTTGEQMRQRFQMIQVIG